MSAVQHPPEHRVVALAARWREELVAVAGAPLWSLSATEAGDALVLLTQARSQLDELLMRVLRHAETVGTGLDTGATTTTNWWAHTTGTTRAEAHRTHRLAGVARAPRHQVGDPTTSGRRQEHGDHPDRPCRVAPRASGRLLVRTDLAAGEREVAAHGGGLVDSLTPCKLQPRKWNGSPLMRNSLPRISTARIPTARIPTARIPTARIPTARIPTGST